VLLSFLGLPFSQIATIELKAYKNKRLFTYLIILSLYLLFHQIDYIIIFRFFFFPFELNPVNNFGNFGWFHFKLRYCGCLILIFRGLKLALLL